MRFTEKFGLDPELSTFSQQETFYVLLGGLSFEEYSTKDFFLHYLPEQRPFYTWQPREKEVFPDQPEFLHYLINADDLPEFRVWMRLFYPDGSTAEEQISQYLKPTSQAQQNQYEIFRFPAGYDQLSVGGYSCQTCYEYELYFTDQNDVQISEARRYRVNHEYYEEKNYFFFLNSLGGYDTLAATGRSRYRLGVDEETVRRELPYDYQPTDRAVEILQKSGEPEVQQPVGYPTKEMMLSLQDFVLSKAYFKYEDGRLIPITVDIRRSTILDRNENLQELEFSYALPRMDKFTPKLKKAVGSKMHAQSSIFPTSTEGNDGSILIAVEGGTAPYSFLWSDGNETQYRSQLVPSSYGVSIRDSNVPPRTVALCDLVVELGAETYSGIPFTPEMPYYEQIVNQFYAIPPGYQVNLDHFYTLFAPGSTSYTAGVTSFIGLQSFDPGTYQMSVYVNIPASTICRYDTFNNNYPDLRVHTSFHDENHLVTGDINLRDQWQELKSVFTVVQTQNRQMRPNLSVRIDAPLFYFSDIVINQLS